jgi:glutaredoxin-related protein
MDEYWSPCIRHGGKDNSGRCRSCEEDISLMMAGLRLDGKSEYQVKCDEIDRLTAELAEARELLVLIRDEAIAFDKMNKDKSIGNPGLRGLLIEPGDVIHRRIKVLLERTVSDE